MPLPPWTSEEVRLREPPSHPPVGRPTPPSRGVHIGPSTSVALQSTQLGRFTLNSSPSISWKPPGHMDTGTIMTDRSDVRWCSDILEILCWNGETVHVTFVLVCHDREAIEWLGRDQDLSGEEIRRVMTEAVQARSSEEAGVAEPI